MMEILEKSLNILALRALGLTRPSSVRRSSKYTRRKDSANRLVAGS